MLIFRFILTLCIVSMIVFTNPISAQHKDSNRQQLFSEFELLPFERQIELTERSLYTDITQLHPLLNIISKRLHEATREQQHRIELIDAYLALANGELRRTKLLLDKIQADKPNTSVLVRLLYFRALIAKRQGDLVTAFSLLNNADQLPKQRLQSKEQFFVLTLAAILNVEAFRYDIAIDYTERATEMAFLLADDDFICLAAATATEILVAAKKYQRLEKASYKAIQACEKIGNQTMLARIYLDFSAFYFSKGNYRLEQQLILKAISLFSNSNHDVNLLQAKLQLINSYIADRQLHRADNLANELLERIELNPEKKSTKLLYLSKSRVLERRGLASDALFYYNKYLDLALQDLEISKLNQLAYFQAQFDSSINQKITKTTLAEQLYRDGILQVGNLQIWLLVVSSLLVLSISAFALTFYHRHQKLSVKEGHKFDELTSVYHFEQGLKVARQRLQLDDQSAEYYVVAIVDIDAMKSINHSYNYDFGDLLIRAFAIENQSIFAHCGIVSRVRRNDFVIFFTVNDYQEIDQLLSKIHQRLKKLIINRQKPEATCSIGYAVEKIQHRRNAADLCTRLVGRASIAVRYAKYKGGNRWEQYSLNHVDKYANEYVVNKDQHSYEAVEAEAF